MSAGLPVNSKPIKSVPDYSNYMKGLTHHSYANTGFLEFAPTNPALQLKYDGMSPMWVGEEATNDALAKGIFSRPPPLPAEKQKNQKWHF
jgi:hypothetical protein